MAYDLDPQLVQQVTLKWQYLGQRCNNVMYFQQQPEGSPVWPGAFPDSTGLLEVVSQWAGVSLAANVSTQCLLDGIAVKQVVGWEYSAGPAPKPRLTFNAADEAVLNFPGAMAGNGLPSYVCVTMRKLTAIPTRRFRGAFRVVGLTEPQTEALSGNFLTAASAFAFLTSWTAINISFRPNLIIAPTAFMKQSVFSLVQMVSDTVNPGGYTTRLWGHLTTGNPINQNVGTQISRKVGHGT